MSTAFARASPIDQLDQQVGVSNSETRLDTSGRGHVQVGRAGAWRVWAVGCADISMNRRALRAKDWPAGTALP